MSHTVLPKRTEHYTNLLVVNLGAWQLFHFCIIILFLTGVYLYRMVQKIENSVYLYTVTEKSDKGARLFLIFIELISLCSLLFLEAQKACSIVHNCSNSVGWKGQVPMHYWASWQFPPPPLLPTNLYSVCIKQPQPVTLIALTACFCTLLAHRLFTTCRQVSLYYHYCSVIVDIQCSKCVIYYIPSMCIAVL